VKSGWRWCRRQFERIADRPVGLVAGKKNGRDLAAVLGQARHRVVDVERLVDPAIASSSGSAASSVSSVVSSREPARRRSTQTRRVSWAIQGWIASSLRSESSRLIDLRKDLLKDVFGVVLRSGTLRRDRVDIAGKNRSTSPAHACLVAVAARATSCAADRLCQAAAPRLDRDLLLLDSRSRLAITWSNFQAIWAFVSTRAETPTR